MSIMSDDTALFAAIRAILIARTGKGLTDAEVRQIKPTIPIAAGPADPPGPAIDPNDALLIRELERDEGRVLHAYQDSLGFWTIGIGRLIDKRKGGGISNTEANYLKANDIARFKRNLDRHAPCGEPSTPSARALSITWPSTSARTAWCTSGSTRSR